MGIEAKRLGMSSKTTHDQLGTGWLHEFPDFRDYTTQKKEIANMLSPLKLVKATQTSLPDSVDLREWCSSIDDQGRLGSCTAHAGVALLEYFEKRATGDWLEASRLFLYKATRNYMNVTGDTGAYIRTTMAALRLFGTLPEKYWPYDISKFDEEPPAFAYAFAGNYEAIKYYRLDPPGTPPKTLLASIRTNIAAGLPSMFGFTIYSSIRQAADTGKIPYPCAGESMLGGHAIDVVGYDNNMKIKNTDGDEEPSTGAFLIRNSWGTQWGDNGYGWLPYDYIMKGLADDWWTVITAEWVNTKEFGLQ